MQERSHLNANFKFKKNRFEKWISYIVQINALYDINVCVWHCFSFIYILYIQSSVMLAMILRIYIYIYMLMFQSIIHSKFPSSVKASLFPLLY